jgi:hypothetical protein
LRRSDAGDAVRALDVLDQRGQLVLSGRVVRGDLDDDEERVGGPWAECVGLELPRPVLRRVGGEQGVVEWAEAQVALEHGDGEYEQHADGHDRRHGCVVGHEVRPPLHGGPLLTVIRLTARPRDAGRGEPRADGSRDRRLERQCRQDDPGDDDHDGIRHGTDGGHVEDQQGDERDHDRRPRGEHGAPDRRHRMPRGVGRRLALVLVVLRPADDEQPVVDADAEADHHRSGLRDRRHVDEVLKDLDKTDAQPHANECASDRPRERPPRP